MLIMPLFDDTEASFLYYLLAAYDFSGIFYSFISSNLFGTKIGRIFFQRFFYFLSVCVMGTNLHLIYEGGQPILVLDKTGSFLQTRKVGHRLG